jgi:protein gp37
MSRKTKISWADSTWNPVTGCLHGCEYCYARKIAKRFDGKADRRPYLQLKDQPEIFDLYEPLLDFIGRKMPYPFAFSPTLHRYRLDEPQKWKTPRNIFVCSMADLFGDWAPNEWIKEVLKACEKAPQHRYLFLTKNPKRYSSALLDRYFPSNMWFGWTQTGPLGTDTLFTAHHSMQTFVSIEPLLKPFEKCNIKGIGWAIVGAETGNRKGKVIPEKSWIDGIDEACEKAGVPLFMKESLRELMGDDFKQEFPWEEVDHDKGQD